MRDDRWDRLHVRRPGETERRVSLREFGKLERLHRQDRPAEKTAYAAVVVVRRGNSNRSTVCAAVLLVDHNFVHRAVAGGAFLVRIRAVGRTAVVPGNVFQGMDVNVRNAAGGDRGQIADGR